MANLLAQSALAERHQQRPEAYWKSDRLTLQERPFVGLVKLQRTTNSHAFNEAVAAANVLLPSPGQVSVTDKYRCLWLTPNEWLFVVPPATEARLINKLTARLNERALITDISDSRVLIVISGDSAHTLLAKGSALDWHPAKFIVGQCAVTRFAGIAAMVHRLSEQDYELFVERSYAVYCWDWLVDAAGEFDVEGSINAPAENLQSGAPK